MSEELVRYVATNAKLGSMSGADLAKLIAEIIAPAIKRMDKRLDHLQRQISMLRSNDRARAARELHDNTMAEDVDD